jgi:hypothetical protein
VVVPEFFSSYLASDARKAAMDLYLTTAVHSKKPSVG